MLSDNGLVRVHVENEDGLLVWVLAGNTPNSLRQTTGGWSYKLGVGRRGYFVLLELMKN